MSSKTTNAHNEQGLAQYEANLQRAITYISQHLADEISLDDVARVSRFSKFHFARLFRAFTGETPGELIRRLRLEKAAYLLIYNAQQPITDIAFQCGFSSSQNMARGFRHHYGTAPSLFRQKFQDISLVQNSRTVKDALYSGDAPVHYLDLHDSAQQPYLSLSSDRYLSKQIQIQATPSQRLVYVRETGRYQPSLVLKAIDRMMSFALPRNLITQASPLFCVFWDNAAITDETQCRVDACVAYDAPGEPKGVGVHVLEGGLMAYYHCEVHDQNFYAHWHALYRHWLPSSGYMLDNRPCVEIYDHIPQNDDEPIHMRIGIPLME